MNADQAVKYADLLLYIQNNLNYSTLIKIYGSHMGNHLYEKWTQSHANILYFITRLDSDNRKKLLSWGINSVN